MAKTDKGHKPQSDVLPSDVLLMDALLDLPNGKLGPALWGWWVAYQARKHGIPVEAITDDIRRSIRAETVGMDTDNPRLTALEKAMQRIAQGDVARGEQIFRDWRPTENAIKQGLKFKAGRKPNTGGPIRKAIAKLLKAEPAIKNPEIWTSLKNKPPRGWTFISGREVEYFEGPRMQEMRYRRFCNVCGEERKQISEVKTRVSEPVKLV